MHWKNVCAPLLSRGVWMDKAWGKKHLETYLLDILVTRERIHLLKCL